VNQQGGEGGTRAAGTVPAVALHGLARRFGQRWVLRGIDLRVEPGEVVALTGRNGSGKTTLLRVCATALRPTRGAGTVFGHDLVEGADDVREAVGFLAHHAGLYDELTAAENLVFACRMSGHPAGESAIIAALEQVGLAEERRERVRGFSAGMRRRLALARLLLRPPRLLLLDEPYASFDADGILLVNRFAARVAAGGGAVLLATHDLLRAQELIHRDVHLSDGVATERGIADGLAATLTGS
jgi:heme exporter protein A